MERLFRFRVLTAHSGTWCNAKKHLYRLCSFTNVSVIKVTRPTDWSCFNYGLQKVSEKLIVTVGSCRIGAIFELGGRGKVTEAMPIVP